MTTTAEQGLSCASSRPQGVSTRSLAALLPIMGAVFIAYLFMGISLPVLPLYVHQRLGLGTFMVGLVSGMQFAAALVTRPWAGRLADTRGAKTAVVVGLLLASVAGLFYLLSLHLIARPVSSVEVLLAGRALLGAAESTIITGALSWGLTRLGAQNTGKVMSWTGTALYAALAAGAPAGGALYATSGFAAVAFATTAIPLGTLVLVLPLESAAVSARKRADLKTVLGAVWLPGIGIALAGIGFGAITAFIVLLYAAHGWSPAWLPFTGLSVAFMAGRVLFGHLPDTIGGAKVALACIAIEAAGLALIGYASWPSLVLGGVVLTGLGYSLVYPGLGVEAIRRAPPPSRGFAMGAYTAFLDLSLGTTSPILGLVASSAGLGTVFVASAVVVVLAALIAAQLMRQAR